MKRVLESQHVGFPVLQLGLPVRLPVRAGLVSVGPLPAGPEPCKGGGATGQSNGGNERD